MRQLKKLRAIGINRLNPVQNFTEWSGRAGLCLQELQIFTRNLQIRTHLFADSVSNFYPVTAYLPKERETAISEPMHVKDNVEEDEMEKYRRNRKTLG